MLRGTGSAALQVAPSPSGPRRGAGEELVRLEHVRRRFRTRAEAVDAVAGVTLALKAGAFHALVGPSGCGKTTLLHLIAGLDRADHGTRRRSPARPHAHDRATSWPGCAREHVAIVPQVSTLVAGLSALDNVALGLRARGWPSRARAQSARTALAGRSASASSPNAPPAACPAASASASRSPERSPPTPALIVADEPTANLDEANAIRVAELLAPAPRTGTCIVCATHDASVTARASTVIAMRDGRVAPGAGGAEAPHAIA